MTIAIEPSQPRDWIQSRLKQDLLNLKFGVAVGDQVEFKRDPVVNAGVRLVENLLEIQRNCSEERKKALVVFQG